MLGGHWFSELFGDPDTADPSTITRTALDTLRDHLGICQTPSFTITRIQKVHTQLSGRIEVSRAASHTGSIMKQHACMWQSRVEIKHYSVAHFDRITAFEAL